MSPDKLNIHEVSLVSFQNDLLKYEDYKPPFAKMIEIGRAGSSFPYAVSFMNFSMLYDAIDFELVRM